MKDLSILNSLITGRVEPHIYAFSTNTIPNYLKVGDTYRPVSKRLGKWKEYFPNLEKKFEGSARIMMMCISVIFRFILSWKWKSIESVLGHLIFPKGFTIQKNSLVEQL